MELNNCEEEKTRNMRKLCKKFNKVLTIQEMRDALNKKVMEKEIRLIYKIR